MGFLGDPVGPKTFPILVGSVAAFCGMIVVFRPDPDPEWPTVRTLGALALAIGVLVAYAYTLRPLGFLIPTAVAASILSYQIHPRAVPAALSGIGLSVGLFVVFRYALGLGLVAFSKGLTG